MNALREKFGWLVVLGFNGPLRQYFSLYRAISRREGVIGEKLSLLTFMQKNELSVLYSC